MAYESAADGTVKIGMKERAGLMQKCRNIIQRDVAGERTSALLGLVVLDLSVMIEELLQEMRQKLGQKERVKSE